MELNVISTSISVSLLSAFGSCQVRGEPYTPSLFFTIKDTPCFPNLDFGNWILSPERSFLLFTIVNSSSGYP